VTEGGIVLDLADMNELRIVKQPYDPTNLFRLNQNIPSAAPDGSGRWIESFYRMDQDQLERAES
jgi:hypothetical protein